MDTSTIIMAVSFVGIIAIATQTSLSSTRIGQFDSDFFARGMDKAFPPNAGGMFRNTHKTKNAITGVSLSVVKKETVAKVL